ncbi:hypothetical protein EV189_1293 [Motilibacter rhizosphaerae]|uniref:Uncharacterized protein n=1 Tax=Motilibacter rhizosphaerae TaxID=598652 RepID=A0A4Q7NR41_9ACTN|nr:hypothetical protein [Motilibacter rhizosphaerae]RZS89526.1 hypothetical protein EV189_1293 [Motilibacter rhizosphaerae]
MDHDDARTNVPRVAGWPAQVRPPGAPDWERTAVAWLFDACPPDYRLHEVLRRHPVVLARFAVVHVDAAVAAAKHGLATTRQELARVVPPEAVEAAVLAWEREGARLLALSREVRLVERALRGERFPARL